KRASLELGGKSPNLLFADCDVDKAARTGTRMAMNNSGQSCNAPSRMLVERGIYDRVVETVAATAREIAVDDPSKPGKHIGPLVSGRQFERVQGYIEKGIAEGA